MIAIPGTRGMYTKYITYLYEDIENPSLYDVNKDPVRSDIREIFENKITDHRINKKLKFHQVENILNYMVIDRSK